MKVRIHLLGPFQILTEDRTIPGVSSSFMQSFITYLAVNDRYPIPRETLAAALWPDTGHDQACASLRKLIFKFKHDLPSGADYLETDHRSCHLSLDDNLDIDLHDFLSCLDRAAQARAQGQAADETAGLKQAVDLYQGDLAPDCDSEWIRIEREGIRARYIEALARLTELLQQAGLAADAVGYAKTWISADPLNERACLGLMKLYAALNDRAAAILTYQQSATILERDLGIEPSAELKQAYDALVRRQIEELPIISTQPPSTNLIGRETEWSLLIRIWAECLTGRQRVVFLSGEAGIGKTRLVSDFSDWLKRNGALIHREECFPLQSDLTYAPLITWIRDLVPESLSDLQRDDLSILLPELTPGKLPAGERPLWIGQWQRTHLFETISQAFQSGAKPRVFILDNLQWCDGESLDWLEYFIHSCRSRGYIFLLTMRPEELSGHPAAKAFVDHIRAGYDVIDLDLARLDYRQTADLAGSLCGRKPSDEQLKWLFTESEGVPLFITELIRFHPLTERTGLAVGISPLPARIFALIEQRLHHLSIPAREVAEIGAVIGGPFSFTEIRDMELIQEESLIHALDELWRRRIIREEGDLYTFTHDKIREVLYAQIGVIRKKWLHLNLAESLEKSTLTGVEADHALIALHFRLSEFPQRAVEHYRLAVVRARSVFAVDHAVRCLINAIELNPIPAVQAELFVELGDLYGLGLHTADALNAYEKSLDNLPPGAFIQRAAVRRKQASLTCRLESTHAGQYYRQAEELLEQISPRDDDYWREWIDLHLNRIEACYWQNQPDELGMALDSIRLAVEQHGSALQKASYHYGVVQWNNLIDRFVPRPETIEIARERLRIITSLADPLQTAEAEFSLGFVLGLAGLYPESVIWLSSSARTARKMGNYSLLLRSLTYLSITHRRQRLLRQTRLDLDELEAALKHCDMPPYAGILFANRAWIEYRQGNDRKAEAFAARAITIWQNLENFYPVQWPALAVLLAVQLHKSNCSQALRSAEMLLDRRQMRLDDLVDRRLQAMATCPPDGWVDIIPVLEDAAYL
jgi:DNA-binding SARP family transcriptional activator